MNRRGFTLIEVMVSLAVISIALVGLLGLQHQTLQSVVRASEITKAALLAQELMTQAEIGQFPPLGTTSGNFETLHPTPVRQFSLAAKRSTVGGISRRAQGSDPRYLRPALQPLLPADRTDSQPPGDAKHELRRDGDQTHETDGIYADGADALVSAARPDHDHPVRFIPRRGDRASFTRKPALSPTRKPEP